MWCNTDDIGAVRGDDDDDDDAVDVCNTDDSGAVRGDDDDDAVDVCNTDDIGAVIGDNDDDAVEVCNTDDIGDVRSVEDSKDESKREDFNADNIENKVNLKLIICRQSYINLQKHESKERNIHMVLFM